jgi:spermidine synthase
MSRGDVRPEFSSTPPGSGWRVGLLLFLSGAAALAHQILWTRRLVDWLGASAETFARVVGAFFLGLALGSAWAAWRPAGAESAWLRVRRAEFLVALTALLPLVVVGWLGSEAMPAWILGGLGRWVLPAVLVGPPAFAMGLVFPAVAEAVVARVPAGEAPGVVRWYGWNTLGGVLGLGWVFFVGLPRLGLVGTALATCGINVVVAVLAGVLKPGRGSTHLAGPGVGPVPGTTGSGVGDEAGRADAVGAAGWGVAAISGFGVLALEVVLQHQVAQVAINSYYSSAVVLAGVLIGLGAAAFVGIGRWGASRVLSLAALVCAFEPILFQALHPGLAMLPYDLPPWRYFVRLAGLVLLVGLPVFGGLGLVFPWLLRQARNGRTVAGWLAVNGVGGWLGTEVSQGWLLPGAGIWGAAGGIGVLYGIAALGQARRTPGDARAGLSRLRAAAPGMLAISIALASLAWNRNRAQVRPVAGDRVVEVGVGREGVVAVVSGATNDWRIVFNNTYTLGGSRAAVNQERQALLPALLHAKPRRVALLGFATGSTTAGAARMPGVESIEAFELSPLAAALAVRHFRPWNRGVLDDPRVRLVVEDARIGILGRSGRHDLVVGDLFMPWRTGEGRLYSREHFASVRRSLAPGGMFCQWFPLFQLTGRQWEVIRRTFREQFPGAFAIRGDFYADLPIVGLCGFADGRGMESLDWTAIAAACGRLRKAGAGSGVGAGAQVGDPLVRHPEGIAMALLGPDPGVGPGTVNTLGNAWIEWDAGRNVCGLREPWMVGVPWAQWARDLHRGGVERIPQEWRPAHDAGQFFLTLEVAVLSKSTVRGNLEAQIPERLPFALRTDRAANWEAWPSRVKISPRAGGISSGNGG